MAIVRLGEASEARGVREGDAVGTLVVGEIEPSGVTFQRDGAELSRRVGLH